MESFLPTLASRVGSWLSGDGPDSDVVISTRIRLARNVRGFPFAARMTDERAGEISELLRDKLKENASTKDLKFLQLRRTTEVCRDALLERFLISRELAASKLDRGVAFDDAELLSVMVNEEDHLRMQSLRSGLDLETAFERMLEVDRALESSVEYAFSDELGYLTSCPTNVGTGLRVSVMLHLPGLALVPRELKKVFNAASRLNLAIRGLHGEGTQASGQFFQLSNQVTLGRTEREVVEGLRSVVPKVVEFERRVRKTLFEEKPEEFETRLNGALEGLRSGKPIALEPAMSGLSTLLLGVAVGKLASPSRAEVLRWTVLIHPGHLQARAGKRLSAVEIDKERGGYLRHELSKEHAS